MSMTKIKPFSSNGEIMMVELHSDRGYEYEATVCRNPDNSGKTGLLEFNNGDVMEFEWDNLKWVRSKIPGE